MPVPVPSAVFKSEVTGVVLILQQIPFAVTGAPPSFETFPPPVAAVDEMTVTAEVATDGSASVVNELFSPYEVPTAFVA